MAEISSSETEVSQQTKEERVDAFPQYSFADNSVTKALLKGWKKITRPSTLKGIADRNTAIDIPSRQPTENTSVIQPVPSDHFHDSQEKQRPLAIRLIRAALYQEAIKKRREAEGAVNQKMVGITDEDEQKEITKEYLGVGREFAQEGRERDEIADQFLNNQKEVRVDMDELGEQMSRFVMLKPPVGKESKDPKTGEPLPPIFFIPGISNDLESTGMLPQELAFEGRTVVIIGYPDSWKGNVTDEFGAKAEQTTDYEPYTTYFKKAIKVIETYDPDMITMQNGHTIDLWGFSTGAVIAAELLKDPSLQEHVHNAVLLHPPSMVDQKHFAFGEGFVLNMGIIRNGIGSLVHDIKNFAMLNPSHQGIYHSTEDHRKREMRAHYALRKKVSQQFPWWENDMKVGEDGKIIVVSGKNDQITKSYMAVDKIRQNPSLTVIEMDNRHHLTPLTEPKKTIDLVNTVDR